MVEQPDGGMKLVFFLAVATAAAYLCLAVEIARAAMSLIGR